MEALSLSFVILTWNSEQYIENCVSSIVSGLEQSQLAYEIFIVDNGSTDQTISVINCLKKAHNDLIHLIALKKNTGTTYPRNLALKKAEGKYICIMDSDVEISPGIFDKLVKNIESDPKIGLCVPRITYPNGRLQKSTDVFPTIPRKLYRYLFLKKIESIEALNEKSEGLQAVDYAISAIWLFKRSLLIEVGYLDEKIFYAPEDVDYCLRIWQAGYQIIYDHSISAIHHTQEISRGFRLNKALINHLNGLFYYFQKHRYCLTAPSFRKTN